MLGSGGEDRPARSRARRPATTPVSMSVSVSVALAVHVAAPLLRLGYNYRYGRPTFTDNEAYIGIAFLMIKPRSLLVTVELVPL